MADHYLKFERKPFQIFWFKLASGETVSYRFSREESSEKVGRLVESGAMIIPDPFRKGAPLGGFKQGGEPTSREYYD